MRLKNWLLEIFTYLLTLLFFYTALSKLLDFRRFKWEINNQPFDNRYTPLLIYALPSIELIVVVLLIWPQNRSKGFCLSAILMSAFTIYVALVTFHFYKQVPCSCAGVFHAMSWPQHLLFNLVFTAISIAGIRLTFEQNIRKKTAS